MASGQWKSGDKNRKQVLNKDTAEIWFKRIRIFEKFIREKKDFHRNIFFSECKK
jgi:hypothetical protein